MKMVIKVMIMMMMILNNLYDWHWTKNEVTHVHLLDGDVGKVLGDQGDVGNLVQDALVFEVRRIY